MKILNKILDIIYPRNCGVCGHGNKDLCTKCEKKLNKQAVFGVDEYENKFFIRHYYIFKYEGLIRKLLINYKFNEKPYLYRMFSAFINKYEKDYLHFGFYDIIIPVPISKKRLKNRGYNQSLLLTKSIAMENNLLLENNVIIKIKNNSTQSSLNKEEREENVQGVYKVMDKEKVKNKKILLLDDIYTTGSTLDECSKELLQVGAKHIDVFTIAKD